MDIKLSGNIRRMRKERSLTQEQLAEVLGVTVGAVYKWEAGLSNPELGMIMELADFFDTSVDVLLGYEMKDNGLGTTIERLVQYINDMDRAGLPEAEKALKRYPNNFWVVYKSADLYCVTGINDKDKGLLMRSLELYERAKTLLPQNDHPKINETTIGGNIAMVYEVMGEHEKAAEIMKKNNTGGIYDAVIGLSLMKCGRIDEAESFITSSFLNGISTLINFMYADTLLHIRRKQYAGAEEVLLWGKELIQELKVSDGVSYNDKLTGVVLLLLGYVKLRQGRREEAEALLLSAKETAERFDSAPTYSVNTIRFVPEINENSMQDILGRTAAEALETCRKELDSREFDKLWKEVSENG